MCSISDKYRLFLFTSINENIWVPYMDNAKNENTQLYESLNNEINYLHGKYMNIIMGGDFNSTLDDARFPPKVNAN